MAARQEVINVHLASLLSRLGFPTQAERKRRFVPDVIVSHHYLGTVLGEAEIGSSWNDKAAHEKLEKRTAERFAQTQFDYIDFVLLIVYPDSLLKKIAIRNENQVEEELARTEIGFGLAYRQYPSKETSIRWCQTSVTVTQIPSMLEEMAKDIVGLTSEEVTKDLIETIEEAGRVLPSLKDMKEPFLNKALDLKIDPEAFHDKNDCVVLTVKTMFTLGGVALLIYELARLRRPLELHELHELNVNKFIEGLGCLRRINYVEIIDSAIKAWSGIPSNPHLNQLLNALHAQIKNGIDVIRRGGWDVLAFIYQRLLSETYRKAYATFYTKLPAAYLLANLSIESDKDKVIDPACGTGSLLVSAFFTKKRYAMSPAKVEKLLDKRKEEPILDTVNKNLLLDIYGLDALETATSLSSGALTLASLAVPRSRLNILNVPVGPEKSGSLDLLRGAIIKSDHGGITLRTDAGKRSRVRYEKVQEFFDLVIMNPPFTRSDRIPTLIGNRARNDLSASVLRFGGKQTSSLFVAGLAKPFLVLADRLCRKKGRIALVLPNSVLSRDGWADIRAGIVASYAIEHIVISFAPGVPNFSSDTQFREILLVLKKRSKEKSEDKTRIVNLFVPIDELKLHEVDALAFGIKGGKENVFITSKGLSLAATTKEFNWSRIKPLSDNWYRLVAFKNLDLTEYHLNVIEDYCVPLSTYFMPGSIVDHTTGMKVLDSPPSGEYFDAVWGSGEKTGVKNLQGKPRDFVVITDRKEVKCKLWGEEFASNLMILRRGQLDTQYALMFQLEKKAISNVWWPLQRVRVLEDQYVKGTLAFVNSTPGIIHMLGERLETRGLWLEFKKGQLMKLPIPAFDRLNSKGMKRTLEENGLFETHEISLLRIRDYLSRMAGLEKKHGTYQDALEEALKDPELKPRATLDKVSLELLNDLGCKSMPRKMYSLTFDEIETLRRIMERGEESTSIKDKGPSAIRKAADKLQRKLEEYSDRKNAENNT